MSGGPRVKIAGAGALGLATAVALADAGCRVTVCDPGGPNASSVAGGMLAPAFEAVLDDAARPHLDLLFEARSLWPALAERTGLTLDRTGALAVGSPAWRKGVADGFARLGLWTLEEAPAAAAAALAPGLADLGPALLTREDWRLDAVLALAALRRSAQASGVAFRRERTAARGDADILVVATGPATELAPELSALSPIKGHILRFPMQTTGAVVRTEGAYAAPAEGAVVIGATMEPGRADAEVDPALVAQLTMAGRRLFPALSEVEPQVATGVRAATPDGLPLAGWSAEPRVIVAAGARRNGWLLAPLVAQVVRACVTGGDPGPYAARLDPRRFTP